MKLTKSNLKTGLSAKLALAGIILAAGLTSAMPAMAQLSNSSNEPITIDADNSRIEDRRAIFSGQVDARQGDVRVLTDEMIITGTKSGGIGEPKKCAEIRAFINGPPMILRSQVMSSCCKMTAS